MSDDETKLDDDDNRLSMSSPAMRPTPRPKPALTPVQLKAQEVIATRSRELTQQMRATQQQRANWITQPRLMRRIENRLAHDPKLRNALFTLEKGGAIAFVSLDPKTQMRVVKNVSGHIKTIARNVVAKTVPAPSFAPDPTDPFNQYNQANPSNIANQQQAAQQANVIEQDNLVNQETTAENNHTLLLTGADITIIAAYKSERYSTLPEPSPEPGPSNRKDASKTNPEEIKALKHQGEARALKGVINNDKKEIIEGLKGIKEVGKEVVSHAAVSILTKVITAAA